MGTQDTAEVLIRLESKLGAMEQLFNKDLAYIKDAVDGTNDRLDVHNGRLGRAEQLIAALQAVQDERRDGPEVKRRPGRILGSIIGLAAGFASVWKFFITK